MIETLGWYKYQWLDIDKIFIAANNRGLNFADGIFETILIKENKPILFDEHLKRLEKSSKILNFNFYQSSAVILQAATPTAISTILMAEAYSVKQKIASKILFTTTLISIITIPLLKIFMNLFI